ncbi:hypothetical protein OAD66_01285 [Bacteroidia bacterium]|nr:hypothetical protein [Bacteroidia bacterium]MDB9881749.1 hypothetical protein [Bacteroidia bacterium]
MKSELESPLLSGFEIFSGDNIPFVGDITEDGFTLRSKRVAGTNVRHIAVAKGIIEENEKGLSILIEIIAFRGIYSFMLLIAVLLYVCLFLGSLYIGVVRLEVEALLSLVFIVFHGAFMIGGPIFLLSKAARILDQNLEHMIKEIENNHSSKQPAH